MLQHVALALNCVTGNCRSDPRHMLHHVAPCRTSITHRKLPVRSEAPGRNKNVARKSAENVPHTRGGIITDYRGQGSLARTLTRTHARTCGTL